MAKLLLSIVAGLLLHGQAACAQQPSPSATPSAQSAVAGRPRPNRSYTGIKVSGKPVFAADRTLTWADYPVVQTVDQDSPAAKVGIAAGDVILSVNGTDGRDPKGLLGEPGKVFVIRVRRDAAVREFTVRSGQAPARADAPPRSMQ